MAKWQVTNIQQVGDTTIKTWENVPSLADISAEFERKEAKRLTQRARDGANCPRCREGVLNIDGYCVACGFPFPPRA